MVLRDGKFYEGETLVPLEFGNKQQLALITKYEALKDGVMVFVDESLPDDKVALKYLCICGANYYAEITTNEWNQFKEDKFSCKGCSLKYILDGESYNPYIIAKLDLSKKRVLKGDKANG